MPRKKTPEEDILSHKVTARLTREKFTQLEALLAKTAHREMAGLVREILCNRTIRTVVHDESLDLIMEELSALRGEIRAIGVNVNQITKHFNTYGDVQRKAFYAKTAFSRYSDLQPKIEALLQIVSKLAKKWLQESPAAGR